jgi:hypothetical protein
MLGAALVVGPALPGLTAAALGFAGLATLAFGFLVTRARPRAQMLWVDVRGVELLLMSSSDHIEVGKATRALRRAIERDAGFLSRREVLTR